MTATITTEEDANVIMQMARKLRIAMEEPLYLQQHQQQPDFFVNEFHHRYEDVMLQLILLASEYPPEVLPQAVLLTNDDSLRLPIHLAWYVLEKEREKRNRKRVLRNRITLQLIFHPPVFLLTLFILPSLSWKKQTNKQSDTATRMHHSR